MVPKNSNESGFSLIEVSIALIVISLLMTPLIYAYNTHMETKRFTMTDGRTDGVRAALLKFYERNGFYPIPATPNIAQGAAGFGASATIPGTGWPACTATITAVCLTGTGTWDSPAATDNILIGTVPIAALGLPFKSMMDGYGQQLTYAVSQNLTATGTFGNDRGAVRIRNLAGIDEQAHFVVVSHGKSRMGAFTLAGIRSVACNTATAPIPADHENCDNDGTFLSNNDGGGRTIISEATGTGFFDDKTDFINTTSYGIWSYIPNTTLDMESKTTGNIKIGCPTTGACRPLAKLDVEGDVLANEVQTSRLCDTNESRCVSAWTGLPAGIVPPRNDGYGLGWFSPNMLTGAPLTAPSPIQAPGTDSDREGIIGLGIACYSDFALRGIRGYDEFCAGRNSSPHFSATTVTNCPAGQFAKAIIITGPNSFTFDCVVSW